MSNQNGSHYQPGSSGIVKTDFDHYFQHFKEFENLNDAAKNRMKYDFFTGYCFAYNRMMQAARTDSNTLHTVTHAMMLELNHYFETSQR
jgi:hypothetical protein